MTMKQKLPTQSSLLINEPPLMVLPSLAVAIGLNQAITIQQLHYWLENPKTGFVMDGFKWVHNTYAEWQTNFPFWSVETIKKIFLDLEHTGLIISAQFDKTTYDRRKYYRVNYDKLRTIEGADFTPSNTPKFTPSLNDSETTSDNDEEEEKFFRVLKLYKENIGTLTPIIVGEIKTAINKHSIERVSNAITLAAKYDRHNWAYCQAILENRKNKNNKPTRRKEPSNENKSSSSGSAKKQNACNYSDDDHAAAEAINNS